MLHCCDEFARKEDMLVEINADLGTGVWNGNYNLDSVTCTPYKKQLTCCYAIIKSYFSQQASMINYFVNRIYLGL